jgi:hypothetical protein
VFITIGIVGLLASTHARYRRVVYELNEDDLISFKIGDYWIRMLSFFILMMLMVIGAGVLFAY